MPAKKIAVLTGAGVSADSGLKTFRDHGGLWEGHDINEVASIHGWNANPQKVLDFYNLRRAQLEEAQPNEAHYALKELEDHYEVVVVTQNVDDLHEKAGSSSIIHLHGELTKARSERDPSEIVDIGYRSIELGERSKDGTQLRPAIVWFGEMVPMIEIAAAEIVTADILIVIGTSLAVYPAAGLTNYARSGIKKFIVDPGNPELFDYDGWEHIQDTAKNGVPPLVENLIKKAQSDV